MRTETTLTIGALAELVRAGVVQPERLTPELQSRIAAFERGELDQEEERDNDDESRDGDS